MTAPAVFSMPPATLNPADHTDGPVEVLQGGTHVQWRDGYRYVAFTFAKTTISTHEGLLSWATYNAGHWPPEQKTLYMVADLSAPNLASTIYFSQGMRALDKIERSYEVVVAILLGQNLLTSMVRAISHMFSPGINMRFFTDHKTHLIWLYEQRAKRGDGV